MVKGTLDWDDKLSPLLKIESMTYGCYAKLEGVALF